MECMRFQGRRKRSYGAWIGCRSRRNLTQHQWTVFGVAVSPDGKYLASSEGTRINVWDLATRSILYIIAETTMGMLVVS